jgi:hypothetical protein
VYPLSSFGLSDNEEQRECILKFTRSHLGGDWETCLVFSCSACVLMFERAMQEMYMIVYHILLWGVQVEKAHESLNGAILPLAKPFGARGWVYQDCDQAEDE